jgi:hypothetical protein
MTASRLLITVLALVPSFALAAPRPGTADYLRDVLHMDEARLTQGMNTEDRKPFAFATGETEAPDAIGDVLDRTGVEAKFSAPWADLVSASLRKEADAWVVTWTLAETFPTDEAQHKIQWLFYADQDGDAQNNAPAEGVRGDMDVEYSIERDEEGTWVADMRWYNKAADFWAIDRETEAVHAFEGDRVVLRIPFVEMSAAATPNWRVVAAVAGSKTATQIDVAPGIGFPPPKTSTEETLAAPSRFAIPDLSPVHVILILAVLAALAYVIGLRLARRRKA